jgi:thiamine-phosphate diphosphorylase
VTASERDRRPLVASPPRLIAITDLSVADAATTLARFERVARYAAAGSVMFQLRDREHPIRERLTFGRELRALSDAHGQWLQVNDRLDLALLLDADAVHLGEGSVAAEDARSLMGDRFVSRACHAPARGVDTAADAWLVSPIFEARKGRPALGVEVLGGLCMTGRTAAGTASGPAVYALGGVNAENAARCLAAGAAGVAVIGAVLCASDPRPLLAALRIDR